MLYLSEYGRARLRGARGHIGIISRVDGREVRPLPGRMRGDNVATIKDWKWMFRISSNWRTGQSISFYLALDMTKYIGPGRCAVEHLREPFEHAETRLSAATPETSLVEQTHILLAGNLIITASSKASPHLPIHLRPSSSGSVHTLLCNSSSGRPAQITTLALDQSPPNPHTRQLRLASFLSTGQFTIHAIDHTNPSASSQILTYVPSFRNARNAPVVQAAYHHPLLATLSQSFVLSIYDLREGGEEDGRKVAHTHTLTSFASYPPASLVLSSLPTTGAYKLVLAYAVPVYPAHWSVGATELVITLGEGVGAVAVLSTRTARALDVPPGWVDERKLRGMQEQWGRRVERVAGMQTDGKWVVLAPGSLGIPSTSDFSSPILSSESSSSASYSPSSERRATHNPTHLQLYRLHLPTNPSAATKLTFIRSLHGHTGPVSALSLADGRCVSTSGGGVWVWDLEGGAEASMGAQVIGNDEEEEDQEEAEGNGCVVFDDRRIVSTGTEGVDIRRFDI